MGQEFTDARKQGKISKYDGSGCLLDPREKGKGVAAGLLAPDQLFQGAINHVDLSRPCKQVAPEFFPTTTVDILGGMALCGGLSCVLQDVEWHLWPLHIGCQSTPLSSSDNQKCL